MKVDAKDHVKTGKRFLELCESFKAIKKDFVYQEVHHSNYKPDQNLREGFSDLKWLLRDMVHKCLVKNDGRNYRTRTGLKHRVAKVGTGDCRKTIPGVIRSFALSKGVIIPEKCQLTWIVCYLHKIAPDQSKDGWKYFECSHRCISNDIPGTRECVDPKCLVWESKAINQSRGHMAGVCCRQCVHCDRFLCGCQSLHYPNCL